MRSVHARARAATARTSARVRSPVLLPARAAWPRAASPPHLPPPLPPARARAPQALVSLFLSPLEVSKVWERALWSEEAEERTLPRVKPRPGLAVRAAMASSSTVVTGDAGLVGGGVSVVEGGLGRRGQGEGSDAARQHSSG